jgi:chorismate mutase-like protein
MTPPFNDPSLVDTMLQLRGEITRIDEQVLNLLAERRRLSHAVAATKDINTAVIRDPAREEDLLVNLVQTGRAKGLDAHFVTRVFHEIIDDSVRIQQEYFQRVLNRGEEPSLRVAIQGIDGSYSALAAKKYLSRKQDGFLFVECQRSSLSKTRSRVVMAKFMICCCKRISILLAKRNSRSDIACLVHLCNRSRT